VLSCVVADCCSVLHVDCFAVGWYCRVLQGVVGCCCSVLQCVAGGLVCFGLVWSIL